MWPLPITFTYYVQQLHLNATVDILSTKKDKQHRGIIIDELNTRKQNFLNANFKQKQKTNTT